MSPDSDKMQGREAQARGHEVFQASTRAIATFPAAARFEGGGIAGTVGAAIGPGEHRSYNAGSRALLGDGRLGPAHLSPARQREMPGEGPALPLSRASDLIAELREISGQVNRMMSQVDRAIHRLGEHAGEPLRR